MAKPPFTPGLGAIRSVEWGQTWHWDAKFDAAPVPFQNWFPAFEVEAEIFNIGQHDFSIGSMTFSHPELKSRSPMTVSFYDNDEQVLFNWLHDWQADIFTEEGLVGTITEIAKRLVLVSTTAIHERHTVIESWVYPTGPTTWIRNSESGAAIIQQTFQPVYMKVRRADSNAISNRTGR